MEREVFFSSFANSFAERVGTFTERNKLRALYEGKIRITVFYEVERIGTYEIDE